MSAAIGRFFARQQLDGALLNWRASFAGTRQASKLDRPRAGSRAEEFDLTSKSPCQACQYNEPELPKNSVPNTTIYELGRRKIGSNNRSEAESSIFDSPPGLFHQKPCTGPPRVSVCGPVTFLFSFFENSFCCPPVVWQIFWWSFFSWVWGAEVLRRSRE
jgi:hypothetical protein